MAQFDIFNKKLNYTKLTPLVWMVYFSVFTFSPCMTTLIMYKNELWWIFLILILISVILFIVMYVISFLKHPDYLETEHFKLCNRKYDFLGDKADKLSITTTINIDENGEL